MLFKISCTKYFFFNSLEYSFYGTEYFPVAHFIDDFTPCRRSLSSPSGHLSPLGRWILSLTFIQGELSIHLRVGWWMKMKQWIKIEGNSPKEHHFWSFSSAFIIDSASKCEVPVCCFLFMPVCISNIVNFLAQFPFLEKTSAYWSLSEKRMSTCRLCSCGVCSVALWCLICPAQRLPILLTYNCQQDSWQNSIHLITWEFVSRLPLLGLLPTYWMIINTWSSHYTEFSFHP